MNLIDRLVAAFSPAAGLRRARFRSAIQAYEAGKVRTGDRYWNAPPTGPNAEIEPALANLRARSRQLVRDNPYAARAISVLVSHQIGTGITARLSNADAQIAWDEWAARCDHEGVHDLAGLMALAARTVAEGGEALIRLRVVSQAEARRRGLTVPLTLQVLEGDMLPLNTSLLPQPTRINQGIEFAADGTRAAYHLRRYHPGEMRNVGLVQSDDLDRVPADQIIHLFHAQRPGQLRGVPAFAPILLRMKQLDDYEGATLAQAKAQSLLGVFVTTPEPMDVPTPDGAKVPGFDLYPGMVHNLPPGAEPKFLQPSGAGGFEPFALHQLMAIAAGVNITYDQITGDLRQANYSSLRAGKIEFRRKVEQDQWMLFIPRMCAPIWSAFAELADIAGLPVAGVSVKWQPPRFEMIDPNKEIGAAIDATRAGFETWDQVVGSFGYDPDEQAQEIQRANARFDQRGLILDVDPRRVANAGSAQNPAQNAAIELGAPGATRPQRPQE